MGEALSYLDPPPMPAPVVVMKDVGGYVNQYQDKTELYRATDREVRLHECRSACTLALSLPNVCVYPDSTLKFHLAYDPRNHQSNYEVSQQLFDSYPPAVRARLGALTRQYKVLRGEELIALGVRNCAAPRRGEPSIMVASDAAQRKSARAQPAAGDPAVAEGSTFGRLMQGVASTLAAISAGAAQAPRLEMARAAPGKPPASMALETGPLPPPRPLEVGAEETFASVEAADDARLAREKAAGKPGSPPPGRPCDVEISYAYGAARINLLKLIGGAQPILPNRFVAYAELAR
ncbi:conserved hypothetical protein [Methylocella silvestris BL2]|uniref:Uncharacterized protein n=1 Tax=Methylocella silvestris (strain DSM 15510 / CIP 108128 / LMG 27833 / NCIMB 13906 / BL2) TaxID=395965 RepID=B8ERP0_METSB|nr:hypothetical protein [Methylocella silvestris]ACK51092.1 conserved hypothetical protein [Methylocella silvestris BL2]